MSREQEVVAMSINTILECLRHTLPDDTRIDKVEEKKLKEKDERRKEYGSYSKG